METKEDPRILWQAPYGQNRGLFTFLFLLTSAGFCLLFYLGFMAPQGWGITARQQLLFRILVCLCGFSPLIFLAMIIASVKYPMRIALTEEAILCPKSNRLGISKTEIAIPFDDIRLVALKPFGGNQVLMEIEFAEESTNKIASNMMKPQAFNELSQLLMNTVNGL